MRALCALFLSVLLAVATGCGGGAKVAVDAGPDAVADAATDGTVLPDATADAPEEAGPDAADGGLPDATDAAPPPDTAPDIGPDPVVPDLLDVPLPDVPAQDLEPDLVPFPVAGFRIDGLSLSEPAFCYSIGNTCVPILDMVNQTLADSVASGEITVVGIFNPFAADQPLTLTIGTGLCNLNTVPPACMLDSEAVPAVYEGIVISSTQACALDGGLLGAVPCFASGSADLALQLFGVTLGLSQATVSGHVAGWAPAGKVDPGVIEGWLPEELAKTVLLTVPVGENVISVTLYELLVASPSAPEMVNGHLSWHVVMQFTASQVELME